MDINNEVPVLKSVDDLQQYLNPLYVIEDYWKDKELYKSFKKRIRNITRAAFRNINAYLKYPVRFKFYADDTEVHELQLRHFLYNIYIWYPFCELYGEKIVDESCIIQPEQLPKVNDFIFEKVATPLYDYEVKESKIHRYMAAVTDSLKSISVDFSTLMGLHYDETTFQKMWDNKEYRELMSFSFDESANLQPIEMEEILNEKERKLVELLRNDKKNPFGVMVRAGTGMKIKQLVETIIMIGLRPSLEGDVISYPINNGFLINGLDRPSYMYIDALGARKPLLANNKEMGPVGYFGKTLNLAAKTLSVSTEVLDCGSEDYVNYHIKTKKHLQKMVGKYWYDEEIDDLRIIKETDTDLIGRTVPTRSVLTCCCGENLMCATCIGKVVNFNWDIPDGFSVFMTEEYSKDVEQNVLSTKHLLVTKSERIEFSDTFYKYFRLDGDEIQLLGDSKTLKNLAIRINPEEIQKVEEYDPNSTYNNYIDPGHFYIVNLKTKEEVEVYAKNDKSIYIRTETSDIMNPETGMIMLKDVEEDTCLFEVSIENNELTKPFYDLMNLLKSKGTNDDGISASMDEMSQRFLDISVEAGFKVPVSAGEIMLNRICRREDDVRKRPSIKNKKMTGYKFYSVSNVVENNASPTVGMIFEQLKRQWTNLNLTERNATSFADPFFKKYVSTEPLFKHRAAIEKEKELGTYDEEED